MWITRLSPTAVETEAAFFAAAGQAWSWPAVEAIVIAIEEAVVDALHGPGFCEWFDREMARGFDTEAELAAMDEGRFDPSLPF